MRSFDPTIVYFFETILRLVAAASLIFIGMLVGMVVDLIISRFIKIDYVSQKGLFGHTLRSIASLGVFSVLISEMREFFGIDNEQ